VPNWTRFGATAGGLTGAASLALIARTPGMVGLTLQGPTALALHQGEIAGDLDQTYRLTWKNIIPDPDKFSWSISGHGQDHGDIALNPMSFAGAISVNLPLPPKAPPGTYNFRLTVTATETRIGDPSKKLTGSTSIGIHINVVRDAPNRPGGPNRVNNL
jgi:hypothetical protein